MKLDKNLETQESVCLEYAGSETKLLRKELILQHQVSTRRTRQCLLVSIPQEWVGPEHSKTYTSFRILVRNLLKGWGQEPSLEGLEIT